MDIKKRQLLKGTVVAGGVGVFAAGYSETVKDMVKGLATGSSGVHTRNAIAGNSLEPEMEVDLKTGTVKMNPNQRVANSMCFGCWTRCGVRCRIDNKTDKIVRICGNPYHPLSSRLHIPLETSIKDSYLSLSAYHQEGIDNRSTACACGNAMLEMLDSPHRVTQCLKRVGPRGSRQWKTIPFEQLVKEVVEGGNLFGEGHVDGLRTIRNLKAKISDENPEYGPKANQLLVTDGSDEGRQAFLKRFTFNSFGTRNFGNHGSYCGFSFRAGSGAIMDDLKKYAHTKPDWEFAEFMFYIGSSPAQSGNPFKRQARQLAYNRINPKFEYVFVSPMMVNTSNLPTQSQQEWIGIRPATDASFAMALLRVIIDESRYNADFLSAPNIKVATDKGFRSFSNATFLIHMDPKDKRYGQYWRASEVGLPFKGDPLGKEDPPLVIDEATGKVMPPGKSTKALLTVPDEITVNDKPIVAKTSFMLLTESARSKSLEEYSAECDVSVEKIKDLAVRFTSHGTKASVFSHGGTMSTNGFYSAWAILMLNAMVGNLNVPGGTIPNAGTYPAFGPGPRYDLANFDGMVQPKGVFLSRSKFPYEKTSEFKRKVAAGKSPYPAEEPWFPFSSPLTSEYLASAMQGYPYKLKAWINHMGNVIYGQPGLNFAVRDALKDPKNIPLIISIDAFINETSELADYIVPDTLTYESWGWTDAWNGTVSKTATGRWPVVEPRTEKTKEGDPVSMETFLIHVGMAMGLPGYGPEAIKGADGKRYPLTKSHHFSLYGAANVAFAGGKPVPDINEEDRELSGVNRIMPVLKESLAPDEAMKAAYMYARGGRFQNLDQARLPNEDPTNVWKKPMMIWNPDVGSRRNSQTGERFSGCPKSYEPRLTSGKPLREQFTKEAWPFLLSSYKSNTMSAVSLPCKKLRQVHPYNPVRINAAVAQKLGIKTGDKVKISTPDSSVIALAQCVEGIHPECLAIEHGFGHWALGANSYEIDGKEVEPDLMQQSGFSINELAILDPSRPGRFPLVDWAVGSAARQGLPGKIEKIG